MVRTLRFNGTTVPPNYEVRFQRTLWLFRHQRVFCPAARAMAHLRPLPPGGLGGADVLVAAALPAEGPEREALEFLGPVMEAEVAAGISEGGVGVASTGTAAGSRAAGSGKELNKAMRTVARLVPVLNANTNTLLCRRARP